MLLVHAGIEVNTATTVQGATPLTTACNHDHTEVVRMLLADGRADIEKANQDGDTPLHTSAWRGHLLCAQLLVIHGASVSAKNNTNETAVESAITDNQPILAEWLTAIPSWSPLRAAAGCRLYKDVAVALRLGRMDPDADDFSQPASITQELIAAIATSKATPLELPWRDAPPICKKTIKLVVAATRGWHRTTHWLHHCKAREAVCAVMMVADRLETKGALPLPPPSQSQPWQATRAVAAEAVAMPLPVLPIEMWFHAMSFIKRSWWPVEEVQCPATSSRSVN